MGVLIEYFRAESRNAAMRAFELGPRPDRGFDAVDGKHIDPSEALGDLIAIIRQSPRNPDIVEWRGFWPEHDTGSTNLFELDEGIRDALATLEEERWRDVADL